MENNPQNETNSQEALMNVAEEALYYFTGGRDDRDLDEVIDAIRDVQAV